MPGVRAWCNLVGYWVVATSWWRRARRATLAIKWTTFERGPQRTPQSCTAATRRRAGQSAARTATSTPPSSRRQGVTAQYQLPLLAHATLERRTARRTCTRRGATSTCHADSAVGSSRPRSRGLKPGSRVHTTFLGGGFGEGSTWLHPPQQFVGKSKRTSCGEREDDLSKLRDEVTSSLRPKPREEVGWRAPAGLEAAAPRPPAAPPAELRRHVDVAPLRVQSAVQFCGRGWRVPSRGAVLCRHDLRRT